MLALDEIRTAVCKIDALAHAAETMFDEPQFNGEVDRQRLERLAHLIGAAAEAAAAAVAVVDRLNAEALDPAIPPAAAQDDWDGR